MRTVESLGLPSSVRRPRFLRPVTWVLVSLFAVVSCSKDDTAVEPQNGGAPPPDSVAVRLVSWNALTGEGAVRNAPATVTEVRFTISSPGLQTIERSIQATQEMVEEKFVVPEARPVRFEVQALDGIAQLVYRGVYYADVTESTDLVPVAMIGAGDTDPPSFAGLETAQAYSDADVELSWDPATDTGSSVTDIAYLIYVATAPGTQDYTFPDFVTRPGKTHVTLSDLETGTAYYIVARAMDPAGNVDVNTGQQAVTTYSANDVVYVNVNSGADSPACGTQSHPCKTITYAVNKSPADRTIRVARGSYSDDTGESLPIPLKPGMTLIGEGDWVYGRFVPQTIVEADTTPVFGAADNTSLIAFYFDSNGGASGKAVLDGEESRFTVFRCVVDGRDNSRDAGIRVGGRYSRIEESKISGFSDSPGRAIAAWGDDIVITQNVIDDNFSGVSFQGDDTWIAHNHITHTFSTALSSALSSDPVILSNYIADNSGDAISLQGVTRPEIISNVIHNNGQRGVTLYGDVPPDSAWIVLNVIVNNPGGGLVIMSGDADVHSNHFACNTWGLYIRSSVEIDARWNSWENDPPTVGKNSSPYDPGCPGTWDICYDDWYAGVPEPLYVPTNGKGGCGVYHYVPPLSKR